jgi:hypothetical protein
MKKFLLGFCLLAFPFLSQGQTKSLNYQAIIMDPKPIEIPGTPITGQPLKNGKVVVRFTLLSKSGSIDYEEFHQTTTDEFGLINLSIGSGLILPKRQLQPIAPLMRLNGIPMSSNFGLI